MDTVAAGEQPGFSLKHICKIHQLKICKIHQYQLKISGLFVHNKQTDRCEKEENMQTVIKYNLS